MLGRGFERGSAVAAICCWFACNSASGDAPTYNKDIASIIQKNCQDCHRPGQVAPFSLLTFDQARKRASDISHVTGDRSMPPWPASTSYGGPFADQRVLPDTDIAKLKAWVEAGCPEGDPKDAPKPREFASDWPLGQPDLILTMPVNYELSAEGKDEFRVFVLPTDFSEQRFIRAVDFKPGNRRVVHHVIAGIDPSGRGRELDARDEKPGYEAIGGFGDGVPLRGFLPIWTPGAVPRFQTEGAGYVLPPKADILIQMHYHRTGKPETDATQVGLYLSDKPLPRQVRTGFIFPDVPLMKQLKIKAMADAAKAAGKRLSRDEALRDILVIAPGEKNYVIKGNSKSTFTIGPPNDRDILVTSVMPHMHWLGKDFTFRVIPPGKDAVPIELIKIDHWNFNWQGTYAFEKPIRLPAGYYFEMEAHFDNSEDNPANPSHPPKQVSWGEETTNEMCIGIYEFIYADGPEPVPGRPRTTMARP